MKARKTQIIAGALVTLTMVFFSLSASAAVTNMTVVGGCPSGENDPFCDSSGNATETNVALVLGINESDVTQVFSGFTIDGLSPPDTDDISDFFDASSGSWSVSDSSITHLAFKASGYYILGELTCDSGDWSTDITMWTPDITTLTCPEGICADAGRSYTISDFRNGGGNIADLSNVRAFSVVPIPAAVWLFGSALAGMFGWSKRKAVLKTS